MGFDISYSIEIVGNFLSRINKIRRSTNSFRQSMENARAATARFGFQMSNLRSMMGTAAVGAIAIFPVKEAIKFESAMADVRKVMKFESPAQFQQIKQDIFAVAEEMGKIPVKVAAIVVAGGKMGIPTKDMAEFLDMVGKASISFDALEGTIGKQIAKISSVLKIPIGKMREMLDVINYLADNTNANAKDMVNIITRTSGVMGLIKMPKKLVAGWGAFANIVEATPELAASGLRMMFNKVKSMEGGFEALLKNPSKTMIRVLTVLKKIVDIDPGAGAKLIKQIFGEEAGRFVEKAINNLGRLTKVLTKATDKTGTLNSMQKEYEIKMKTADVIIKKVTARFRVIATLIGDTVLISIKNLGEEFEEFMKKVKVYVLEHPKLMRTIVITAAALAGFVGFIVTLGILAASLSAILGFALTLGKVLGFIFSPIKMLGLAFGFLTGPIGLLILTVGIFAAVFYYLYKRSELVRESTDKLLKSFGPLWESTKRLGGSLVDLAKSFWDTKDGEEAVTDNGAGLSMFLDGLTWVVEHVTDGFDALAAVFDAIVDIGFDKTMELLYEALMAGPWGEYLDWIIDKYETISNLISKMTVGILGESPSKEEAAAIEHTYKTSWEKIDRKIIDFFKNLYNSKDIPELLGSPSRDGVVAENARLTAGRIAGQIEITTSGDAKVERASMETSGPLDLGFNMPIAAGAQ